MISDNSKSHSIAKRFRGFLPIVVDVETGGVNFETDALLEIAAITLKINEEGNMVTDRHFAQHVIPFEGSHLDPESLQLTKIDPYHPFRFAITEQEALEKLFDFASDALTASKCQRAILVGHNAWFDLFFLKAAMKRCRFHKTPFHAFSTLDTATLGALAYGQTVLARSCEAAGIPFNRNEAHSAIYDAEQTARLFCHIVNRWRSEDR
jgi:ribonuclease T